MNDAVLVTGGAGFIGSHTVAALRAAGRRVVVLDDFSTGRRENLSEWTDDPQVEVVEGDVRGEVGLLLAGHGPFAAVVHLAAQTSVVRSIAAPIDDLDVNLRATTRLALWAAAAGVRRFVFASSAAVYGEPRRVPVAESEPTTPLSPYGAAKRAAELYLGCLGPLHGLSTVCLRLFNVYGPRQDPKSPYSGVVAMFLARARAGEPLTIFGDGQQTRDLIYVGDVARAICLAAGAGSKGMSSGTRPRGHPSRRGSTSAPDARCRSSSWRRRCSGPAG
ncbi:NAD-dependent epimerase/dehydratase family protein [Nannocystis pusilla]|uniref:NAD-dependent epimerase/dehydratase family protein n=1 Tax=Nannocystis pusilla TaxID=889268 RepID=UPI003B7C62A4